MITLMKINMAPSEVMLGGGFKYFLCSPRSLGKFDPI